MTRSGSCGTRRQARRTRSTAPVAPRRARTPAALRARGMADTPPARAAHDHGPGRGPSRGPTPTRAGDACPSRRSSRRRSSSRGMASPADELFARAVEGSARVFDAEIGPLARGWHAVYRPGRTTVAPGRARAPAGPRDDAPAAGDGRAGRLLLGRACRSPGRGPGRGRFGVHGRPTWRPHESTWETPLALDYRGVAATTHPPNSCGVIGLEVLGILALASGAGPGRLRPGRRRGHRRPRPALGPRGDRGHQARARRPRRLPDRPGVQPVPRGAPAGSRVRGPAGRPDRPRHGPRSRRPRRTHPVAGPSTWPWSTARATRSA